MHWKDKIKKTADEEPSQWQIQQENDRKIIKVVWACYRRTSGTCLRADNRNVITREKKRKVEDKVDGCCGQRPENGVD